MRYEIVINGRKHWCSQNPVPYAAIVLKALYDLPVAARHNPSVSFSNADQDHHEGIFNKRTSVKIKNGTRFNCHLTNRT